MSNYFLYWGLGVKTDQESHTAQAFVKLGLFGGLIHEQNIDAQETTDDGSVLHSFPLGIVSEFHYFHLILKPLE